MPQVAHEETYETLGRRLLEAADRAGSGQAAEDPRASPEQRLLARLAPLHHVFELGVTEVWVPARGLDARGEESALARPKPWPMLARLAVELQGTWYERLAPADEETRARGRAALETLSRWAKRVQPKSEVPRDEALLAAARELRVQWAPDDVRMRVVVAPTRAQFVGLLGASGVFVPRNKQVLWTALSLRSANTYFLPTALAFALVGGPLAEEDPPLRERELEAEALRTYAAHALSHQLSNLLVPSSPFWFGEGLALFDTVGAVGLDETLCAGYSGRKATSVDDVQSTHNALIYARIERSPYRSGGCKDLFVDELRNARVAGGFRVLDLDTSREGVVLPGPFLVERAALPELVDQGPRGLKEGYAEFFRAYCGAFVAFLAAQPFEEGGSLLDAALRRLHERRYDASAELKRLSSVLGELTGKTLGQSLDPERDLEGDFVAWLATRR